MNSIGEAFRCNEANDANCSVFLRLAAVASVKPEQQANITERSNEEKRLRDKKHLF